MRNIWNKVFVNHAEFWFVISSSIFTAVIGLWVIIGMAYAFATGDMSLSWPYGGFIIGCVLAIVSIAVQLKELWEENSANGILSAKRKETSGKKMAQVLGMSDKERHLYYGDDDIT